MTSGTFIHLALALVVGAALSPADAAAAERGRLTPQMVLALRSASDVALSPDGANVVYCIERPRRADEPLGGPAGELWRVTARGGPPVRLEGTGFNARQPRWSPDGQWLAWIAQRDPQSPAQLFVRAGAATAAGTAIDATGEVEEFAWSPDSTQLAFTAWDPPPPAERGRDWIVFGAAGTHIRLHTVQLATREKTLVTRADLSVRYFDWSPDGSQFAIGAAPSPSEDDHLLHVQPYVVDATGGTPRLLAEHFGRLSHPRWSADGKWIAWLASTAVTDPWTGSLFAIPAAAPGQPRNLTAGYRGSTRWLGALPGHPATMVFIADEGQASVLRAIDLASGRVRALAPSAQIVSAAPSFSRDGRFFAVAANAPEHPDEVFIGNGSGTGMLKRLTFSNPSLEDVELGRQSVARWRSKDGLEIEGVLVEPAGYQPGKRYPVVVHVHGGSEGVSLNGWLGSYNNWGQLLAARGHAVIYPNYRGSRGRGVEFVSGNRRDVMGREWEDIEAALDHVIAAGIGDAARAGIYGFSWGGYAAGWGATFASHRFKAAVGGAGIYNWISEAGTNDTRMHEQLAHWDAPLYEHFPLYLERSPIYEIRKAATPVLLLHGQLDESCPVGQAIEFHTALRWKKVPVELVIYPREGHGMREAAHREDFMARGLAWFDRYLGSAR